ncbi:MAG: molecular chaperone [Gammaproteobacteria bacterium]|nr:molecular chaperone [Gammaproteobacteria bacterium]
MATPVIYIAELQDEDSLFSLGEICERCGVPADIVVEMVEYGIVRPVTDQRDNDRWQFDTDALLRMSRAQRLRRDLELDPAGLALALELLDEIDTLQRQVRTLQQQLRHDR